MYIRNYFMYYFYRRIFFPSCFFPWIFLQGYFLKFIYPKTYKYSGHKHVPYHTFYVLGIFLWADIFFVLSFPWIFFERYVFPNLYIPTHVNTLFGRKHVLYNTESIFVVVLCVSYACVGDIQLRHNLMLAYSK